MDKAQTPVKVALVAGEHSGDILGSGLMAALKSRYQDVEFIGVGGPLMEREGLSSFFPMEDLSIMGLAEVVRHLPKLLKHRRQLVEFLKQQQPDVFIGIDAPDFNLTVEKRLKATGIKTVHYVSPSVWAWRKGRIKGIKEAVDHVLCLLPFEKQFYDQHDLPATFVGHPLADAIPRESDKVAARSDLGLAESGTYIGLLPGSRKGELARMAPVFLHACKTLKANHPELQFVAPMVNQARADELRSLLTESGMQADVQIVLGRSREVMSACDYLLLTSGTVALEALLIKRPMVVAYRFAWLSYQIIKRLFHAPFFSLPNLLAGRAIVPELAQSDASVERIVANMEQLLQSDNQALLEQFDSIHQQLDQSASQVAADVVSKLLKN
ncbi:MULTISPECIES: lipid-A-disaccharide synthase [unclassified Idiomarina]|uniref:lipid-A-disaccharide synthase n=1 Tax=unclassified Idiomarina TaxID=2614829 RepID=UPI000C9709D2|nr:lipid-A-disaccharide synthase [Idiomarina sp. UBA3162]MAD54330.1 lipid-A-disaccharide synthase [Idiomarinaceae bacterium]MEC7642564.1 lipid-A-disaccharide synthase [Pseudomonadota bacterium]